MQVRAKVMDLLAYLAARQGQVVSKDDLLTDVWDSLSVSESSLTRTVAELRHALGDEADRPRLLETIAKRGYRLIEEVEYIEVDGTESRPEPRSPELAKRPGATLHGRRRTAVIVGAFLALGSVSAFLARDRTASRQDIPVIGATAVPVTADPGFEIDPSLSPDGSQVVFAQSPAGGVWDFDLAVRLVGEGPAVALTSDVDTSDISPAWSPDGRRVAFLRRRTGAADRLMVIGALGGTARQVLSLTTDASLIGDGLLAWMPDGRHVVVAGRLDDTAGVWLVNVDDSQRRLVLTTPDGHVDRVPAVSRDGRHIAFTRKTPDSHAGLCVVALDATGDSDGPVNLLHDPAPREVMGLAWGPDDASIIIAVGKHPGPSRLERVRLAVGGRSLAGPPEVLPVGTMAYGADVAATGRLVYSAVHKDARLWQLDLSQPGRGLEDVGPLDSTLDEAWPHVSPDGTRLAFVSTRSGVEEIWLGGLDGSGLRQVTRCGGPSCTQPRWSPDGRQLVFTSEIDGVAAIRVVDLSTGVVHRLPATSTRQNLPRWSRDGAWIYFTSFDGSRPEIWRMRSTGADASQVTRTGGFAAEETSDGRALILSRGRGGRIELWRIDIETGGERLLASGLAQGSDFAVGRDSVFYLVGASHGQRTADERRGTTGTATLDSAVMRVDLDSGARRIVASFTAGRWYGFALSPDERALYGAFLTADSGMDLMVVEPELAASRP